MRPDVETTAGSKARRAHAGAQDGMTRVSSLSVGDGLNHLGEVEVPEGFAESVGGRLISLHMWQPTGHDLLSNPLC